MIGGSEFQPDPWFRRGKVERFLLAVTLAMIFLLGGGKVEAAEPTTIGLVEDVILLPWGVKIPARIDTGAAISSLDARGLMIKGKIAEFSLPEKYGGLRISRPIVAWRTIRSAEAQEERPVVMLEFCLGSKIIRTRVNLNDRSQVRYPLLVGRSALRKYFVVDCMKERCAPPACPEVQPK